MCIIFWGLLGVAAIKKAQKREEEYDCWADNRRKEALEKMNDDFKKMRERQMGQN